MLVRVVGRVLSARVLLIALVFFVALAVELGRWGGLQSFFSSVPFAADFALDYLANLTRGNLGTIAPTYASAPAVPVTAELARALPRSLGLLAVALALAVLVGMPLGIGAGSRRKTRFSGLLVFLFVRTAHAKGLGPRLVLFHHVLRNAGVPLLTTVAVSLRFSLAVLPIVG